MNKQKCPFSQSKLEFLGHKIGRGRTSPHPNKVKLGDSRPGTTEQCVRAQECVRDGKPLGTVPTTLVNYHETTERSAETRQCVAVGL